MIDTLILTLDNLHMLMVLPEAVEIMDILKQILKLIYKLSHTQICTYHTSRSLHL